MGRAAANSFLRGELLRAARQIYARDFSDNAAVDSCRPRARCGRKGKASLRMFPWGRTFSFRGNGGKVRKRRDPAARHRIGEGPQSPQSRSLALLKEGAENKLLLI